MATKNASYAAPTQTQPLPTMHPVPAQAARGMLQPTPLYRPAAAAPAPGGNGGAVADNPPVEGNLVVLAEDDADKLPKTEAVFGVTTILVCYFIAVGLKHVSPLPHIPMISDLCVYFPEAWLFRIGLITAATQIAQCGEVISAFFRAYDPSWPVFHQDRMVKTCYFSAICLAGVASVSENEDNKIHSALAVGFFLVSNIYMGLVGYTLYKGQDPTGVRFVDRLSSKPSWYVKGVLNVISFAFLIQLVIYSAEGWGAHGNQIAFCEWSATLAIIAWYYSWAGDFKTANIKIVFAQRTA